jgi:hypothetical protein
MSLSGIETAIEQALAWSETEINSFFTGVEAAEAYVTKFFTNEGPVLISNANKVKADIDALAPVVSAAVPSIAAEVTVIQTGLDGAITVFDNLVSGLVQGSQQGSPAAMAVSPPSTREQLTALRNAQGDVDIAKAKAAQFIAAHGMKS